MRNYFFAWVLLFTLPVQADILFLDLNLSINELAAANRAAKARGEKLLVFPERSASQQKSMEAHWRLTENKQMKLIKCLQSPGANCDALNRDFEAANQKMKELIQGIKPMSGQAFKEVLAQLRANGVRLSSVIFSGHSGGFNYSGLFGSIMVQDVKSGFDQTPELLEGVKSILLWGCYSGTIDALYNFWRKNFSTVPIFAGYESRSPLGIRETGARLLTSFYAHETALLKAKTVKQAHSIFKKMDLVADLDGTALVGDIYMTYDEADLVSNLIGRCNQFPEPLLEKYRCYKFGMEGCENPPANHQGPLRELYSFLQVNRHCAQLVREKYPDIPTPENLIRLIYIDNVKDNFVRHHRAEFPLFNRFIDDSGFPTDYRVENFVGSNRRGDIARFSGIISTFTEKGIRDGSLVDDSRYGPLVRSLFAVEALGQVLQSPFVFAQSSEPCVPFSWVDRGSAEVDTCTFSVVVKEPLPAPMQDGLNGFSDSLRISQVVNSTNRVLMNGSFFFRLEELSENYLKALIAEEATLKGYNLRSQAEEEQLARLPRLIAEAKSLDGRQVALKLVGEIQFILGYYDQRLEQIKDSPNFSQSVAAYQREKDRLTKQQLHFKQLLGL